MASNNRNNTKKQQQNNEKKSGSNWVLPAVVGGLVGAGLAYVYSKNQPESCPEQR